MTLPSANQTIQFSYKQMPIGIHFSVTSQTKFGEGVYVSGNIQSLGSWQVENALKLSTNEDLYPQWKSIKPLLVPPNTYLEFKMFIKNNDGEVVRWEKIKNNRTVLPTASIMIIFEQNNFTLSLQRLLDQPEELPHLVIRQAHNRRNTTDILNQLSDYSESSSGNQTKFWEEKHFKSINNSDIVEQFLLHAKITIDNWIRDQKQRIKQMNQKQIKANIKNIVLIQNQTSTTSKSSITQSQESQQNLQTKKRNSNNRYYPTQQLLFNQLSQIKQFIAKKQNIQKSRETIIFHITESVANKEVIDYLISCTYHFIVVYMLDQIEQIRDQFPLPHILVIRCLENLENTLSKFKNLNWTVTLLKDKKFLLRRLDKTFLIIHQSNILELHELTKTRNNIISQINYSLVNSDLFQKPASTRIKKLFQPNFLKTIGKRKCIIIVNCDRIKDLPQRIINDLISVSSKNYFEVILMVQDDLQQIYTKIPISEKNRMIVLNSFGDIFSHHRKSTALCDALSAPLKTFISYSEEILYNLSSWKSLDFIEQVSEKRNTQLILKFQHPLTTSDIIYQYIEKQIASINLVCKYPLFLKKVIIGNYFLVKIRPIMFSVQFYVKTILSMSQSIKYPPSLFYFDFCKAKDSLITQKIKNLCAVKNIICESFHVQQNEDWQCVNYENLSNILRRLIIQIPPETHADIQYPLTPIVSRSHFAP